LAQIRQLLEIIQKDNRFAERPEFPRSRSIVVLRKIESEDHDRFSTSALCHALLHPIALSPELAAIASLPIGD